MKPKREEIELYTKEELVDKLLIFQGCPIRESFVLQMEDNYELNVQYNSFLHLLFSTDKGIVYANI